MQILKETSLITAVFLFICYLKFTISQCPPSEKQLKPLMTDLKAWWETMKKTKPGTNPKDVDFVMYKMAKELFSSKKFSPCNDQFDWNEIEKDAVMSRKECYHPQDYSKESVQKEFKECMSKLIPPMAMRYTAPSLEACDCFASKIIPNYQTKYRKLVKAYFDEFKTLKHRKGK